MKVAPETAHFPIVTLHHAMIAIPTGGEAQARRFYGTVLGLQELSKPNTLAGRGGLWFALAGSELHLGTDPDFRPATKAHIALQVENSDVLADQLRASGVAINPDTKLPGFTRFYVRDPFGNRIEILSSVSTA